LEVGAVIIDTMKYVNKMGTDTKDRIERLKMFNSLLALHFFQVKDNAEIYIYAYIEKEKWFHNMVMKRIYVTK